MQLLANIYRSQSNNLKQFGHFGMIIFRKLSSNQLQTALRPFFFMVHPDLFGKFPEQRAINENSLQILSQSLESLQKMSRFPPQAPKSLPFYLRIKNQENTPFKLIKVPLQTQRNTQNFVKDLLKVCEIDTTYIEKLTPTTSSSFKVTTDRKHSNDYYKTSNEQDPFPSDFDLFQFKVRRAMEDETLEKFMQKNMDIAQIRMKSLDELREEVSKLKLKLEKRLELKEIIYDCGWNYEHFRGCLKSLEKLYDLYEDVMKKNLQHKNVVFASFTGVSLDGDIHLFTGDVQNNWLDLIKHIPEQESYLSTIPMYENTLAQVLLGIKISRRKFMPKALASKYSSHLSRVITSLLDYLSTNKYPKSWPESLSDYELVIESEAGPLMLSPTGQLITPSTCPGVLLVDFITCNMEDAKIKQDAYKKNKYIERDLLKNCLELLEVKSLLKDDNITPDLMIGCLEKLLNSKLKFKNLNLHITNYYSILNDGTICIPYNWK